MVLKTMVDQRILSIRRFGISWLVFFLHKFLSVNFHNQFCKNGITESNNIPKFIDIDRYVKMVY